MNKQSGITLAITLIILFLVTLIGVSALQVSHLEEKMSSNLQDKQLSFAAGESALTAGEQWVLNLNSMPSVDSSCSTLPCVHSMYQNTNFISQNAAWWQSNAASYSSALKNVSTAPRYLVEYLEFVSDNLEIGHSSQKARGVNFYRVTAKGTGTTNTSTSILQSTLGRRF